MFKQRCYNQNKCGRVADDPEHLEWQTKDCLYFMELGYRFFVLSFDACLQEKARGFRRSGFTAS